MKTDQTLSLADIKKRVKASFVSLTVQQIILRAVAFISINIILAKLLPVETLGIFNIAISIITFFAFFADVGLAASLIQKKDQVEEVDIKTAFTIQLLIVGGLSLLIILSAPFLGRFYGLNEDGVWLIRILGITFFLSSLKIIPAVLLERELRFNKLVLIEIIETFIFNGLLIYLVKTGWGIWGFSIASMVKSISGVITIYLLAPVKLGLGIDKGAAKKLLSYGIPFQLNVLLALLKDRLVPLVVARMVGPVGIGYITWSQSLAFLPLEIMNIVNKITFPAFSRMQHDKEALARAVEKSLFLTTLLSYPLLFGLVAILPAVISYIVSDKWQPALPSFYLFAFSIYWAIISTTFTNVLNAMGHIKTTLKLMILWTTLTWILTPLLVLIYGFNGVALSSFLISFTSVLTIILVKRLLSIQVVQSVSLPTLASLIMGISVYFYAQLFVRDSLSLGVAILLGGLVYLIEIFLFGKEKVMTELKSFRNV